MTLFKHLKQAPPDAIFGLQETFKADQRSHKINLAIGVYKDTHLKTPTMEAVKRAERLVLEKGEEKVYLPIRGDERYLDAVERLFLGERVLDVSSVQSIGGTGALRLGAECLKRAGFTTIHLPTPTWANHDGIFTAAGIALSKYPYYDRTNHRLCFDEMKHYLQQQEKKGVVLFHASCHNPSGADLTLEQWEEIAAICAERELFPFFDSAYLGFAKGLDEDAFAIRHFANKGMEFFLAVSFSKSMGLYGERVGALIAHSPVSGVICSVLKSIVRTTYSNPPRFGAAVVTQVLSDATLKALWIEELTSMRMRILTMRKQFAHVLQERDPGRDYAYILGKNGMFTFSGLSPSQVDRIIAEHAIYMTQDGRINLSGLTEETLPRVVEAIVNVK